MMMTLFDEEQIARNHDESIRREAAEKAAKEATKIAMEKARIEKEKATKKANEQAVASLVGMCKKMNGSILDVIETVMADYNYSEKDATAIVYKYWNDVPVTININMSKDD